MEFSLKTVYDQKACTAMAKAARKTVRKKRSRIVHTLAWILIVLYLLLNLPMALPPWNETYVFSPMTVLSWFFIAVMLAALFFEDQLNGFITLTRLLPGLKTASTVFSEESYTSTTPIATTQWQYENIAVIAEVDTYLVLFFSTSHAQVYDLRTVEGGSTEEFKAFLTQKTGKPLQVLSKKKK